MKINADEQELSKFAAIAAHWWDEAGEVRTLHQVNPLRLAFIQGITNLSGKKVLDVGCGGGILTEGLAKLGAEVTGLDLNPELIEVAKLHLYESQLNIEYVLESVETLAEQRPQQYDVVTCLEMLEHVPDPVSIIKAISKLVKPQGHLFFSTLNRNAKSYLFAILGAEYVLKMLPKNTHDYAKFIKPSELSAWLRTSDAETKHLRGINYNPFTKQFSLSDDISVNYLLHAIKQ